MGAVLVLVLGFFGVEVVGYLFHRLLHTKWMGPLHRSHMAHHLEKYPPQDYLSETYRSTGIHSTTWRFVVLGVILAVVAVWVFPVWASVPVLVNLAGLGALNDWLHDAQHIRGHWLERFGWFQRLRAKHYVHHVDMSKNYGIVTFFSDRAAGTYRAP